MGVRVGGGVSLWEWLHVLKETNKQKTKQKRINRKEIKRNQKEIKREKENAEWLEICRRKGNDITNKQPFEWIKEKKLFSFLLSVYFLSFLIIFLSFPTFSMLQSSHFFLLFNPIQDFSFIAPSFIKSSFYRFIMFFLFVILIFFLLLLSWFIQFFQSLIFANFSLSFIWNFVLLWYPFSFLISLYLFCVFHLWKLIFLFSFPFF